MESAELKTKKRVRHCYPRKEVYHRWVHNETLVYHSQSNPVWGKYDWLMVGKFPPKKATKTDIAEMWGYHKDQCIAVIDREKKRVLIRNSWKDHSYYVRGAVPKDYEVFFTNDCIPTANIIRDEEELCKLHVKYLIELFTEYHLREFYNYLAGRTKLVHYNIDNELSNNESYKRLIAFIKKYHLFKYKWVNISLNENYKLRSSNTEWWKTETQPIPSIRKLYFGKVFTKDEVAKLKVRYFYTKWCYGNGIPSKDAEEHYNKEFTYSQIRAYCNKRCISIFHQDDITQVDTFQNWIERIVIANNAYADSQWEEKCDRANQNYKDAMALAREIKQEIYTVRDWREHKAVPSNRNIPFQNIHKYGKDKGTWFIDYIIVDNIRRFDNIQLRLSNDRKNRIETSNHAAVSLDDGIRMFKLFLATVYKHPTQNLFEFKDNYKVGIYNLRFIKYTERCTDFGKVIHDETTGLPLHDWLIQIGCHSIWLTEVIDFIEYYGLADQFGLPTNYQIKKLYSYERNS